MTTLIQNIHMLVGCNHSDKGFLKGKALNELEILNDAWLLIEDDKIADFGTSARICSVKADHVIDAKGGSVFPSFCDSHTHIVYAGNREQEFVDRLYGLSYVDIEKRGGGILNSALRLHETDEDELYRQALVRVNEMIGMGTGAIEIKSGYGLTTEDELKMLRVIKRLKETTPVTIRSTFLGAHTFPAKYKGRENEYVDLLVNEMIPLVAKEKLADYVDVFCDIGYFTVEQTDRILKRAAEYGMKPKIHANELGLSGGVQVAVANKAVSADHLEFIEDNEIESFRNSKTMPTLLPGASFFLGMKYAPARLLIENGLPVALATDYNPGSSPSGNMKFVISLACLKMKMTPSEAINASTINGAYAMELNKTHGSFDIGKKANLFITKPIPSIAYLPYAYTESIIEQVILNGKFTDSTYS